MKFNRKVTCLLLPVLSLILVLCFFCLGFFLLPVTIKSEFWCGLSTGRGKYLYQQSRYDEALVQYQEALTCYQQANDQNGQGTSLSKIGAIYNHQGRYDDALNHYQQALTIFREASDRAMEGTTLNNIAGVYRSRGQYDEAMDYYQQALAIFREVDDRTMEGATLNNIGIVSTRWVIRLRKVRSSAILG